MTKVLHYVSIMDRGGQETFIMNVFRVIDRSKLSFDFLCSLPGHGDYDDEIDSLGGRVLHVKQSKIKGKLKQVHNFFLLYQFLKKRNREYKAFHIHTQHAMDAYRDALAAKLAGIPLVIVHSHSTSTQAHIKAHKLFRKPLNKLKILRFACSDLAGKWLYGENGDFVVMLNGIDMDQYRFCKENRERVRQENRWENKLIIGHVGRMSYPKNHELILKVYQALLQKRSDVRLVLAGDGELLADVKAMVTDSGLQDQVEFLGMRTDVYDLGQGFDVMLFPSRYEGLGIALIEAQCAGLPCVISDVIPKGVDISDRITRLSLDDAPELWAEKVLEAAEQASQSREAGYLDVLNSGYCIENTAKRLTDIYCC